MKEPKDGGVTFLPLDPAGDDRCRWRCVKTDGGRLTRAASLCREHVVGLASDVVQLLV